MNRVGEMMLRVQIYSPHPDDAEIFVGGTLLSHLAAGDSVQVILGTGGGRGTLLPWLKRSGRLAAIRTGETERRYRRTPEVQVSWLDWEDGRVRRTPAALAALAAVLDAGRPDVIYLPEHPARRAFYSHPDHLAMSALLEEALAWRRRPLRLRHYHSNLPNLLIEVAAYEEQNRQALRCYRSQFRLSCDPPLLLYRRELVRRLLLRRWGPWNHPWVHRTLNWLQAAINLPPALGTEAFREEFRPAELPAAAPEEDRAGPAGRPPRSAAMEGSRL